MDLKNKKSVTPYDLWESLDGEADKKNSKTKRIHPSCKRNNKTPLPHPGQSYNPDPEDHKKLLNKIAQKELEFQKKEALIKRAFDTIKVDSKELQEHENQELVAGIRHLVPDKDGRTEINLEQCADSDGSATDAAYSDYDEKDFEAISKDRAVKEKRKTKRQRLAQLRDKLQRKAAKLRKLKNIRLAKIDGVKKISKELDKKEKELAAKQKKPKHRKTKDERLGSKFERSDPIYCLPSELPSNLRQVKCPMDKIVREQLESFQSRLLVEPTKLQTKSSKYKKKQFERRTAEEIV